MGRIRARYLTARLPNPPVRPVRETFASYGSRERVIMGRVHFASSTVHSPWTALRVRWVPLFPSFQRLGAFALSPHPNVRGFPTRRLLCPIRLFLRALAFRWGLPYLLPAHLHIPQEVSRVPYGGLKQDDLGGALSTVPSALCGSPDGAWSRGRLIHALFH